MGDPISIHQILSLGAALQIGGPILAVLVIWFFGQKAQDKALLAYREDTKTILSDLGVEVLKLQDAHRGEVLKLQMNHQEQVRGILADYKADMVEQRRMYDNNVLLVKDTQDLCRNLKDIVILNSTGFQKLDDDINRKCAALKDTKP